MNNFELRNDSDAWTLRAEGASAAILASRTRADAVKMSCQHLMGLTGPSCLRVFGEDGRVEEEYVYPRCDALLSRSRD